MSDQNEMLALNQLTGLAHRYNGTMPGGIASEENGFGIGIAPCGCDEPHATMMEEGLDHNKVMVIERRHLEAGIWEAAPCLRSD